MRCLPLRLLLLCHNSDNLFKAFIVKIQAFLIIIELSHKILWEEFRIKTNHKGWPRIAAFQYYSSKDHGLYLVSLQIANGKNPLTVPFSNLKYNLWICGINQMSFIFCDKNFLHQIIYSVDWKQKTGLDHKLESRISRKFSTQSW